MVCGTRWDPLRFWGNLLYHELNTQNPPTVPSDVPATTPEPSREKVITITLPTDTYFMSGIRDFTLTMARNLTGMNDQWAYRFQSVIDELCNNAIEHGSAPGQLITIIFRSVQGKSIDVIVEDTGTGKTTVTAKDLDARIEAAKKAASQPLQNLGLRGRGLSQIVSNWTTELHFEDRPGGGLRVIARKVFTTEEQHSPPAEHLGFVAASS